MPYKVMFGRAGQPDIVASTHETHAQAVRAWRAMVAKWAVTLESVRVHEFDTYHECIVTFPQGIPLNGWLCWVS